MEANGLNFPVKQEQAACNIGFPQPQVQNDVVPSFTVNPPWTQNAAYQDGGALMHDPLGGGAPFHQVSMGNSGVKKPRKRPVKEEMKTEFEPGVSYPNGVLSGTNMAIKQEKITDHVKVKKKRDRFKGMSEEEVLKRVLPDHLTHDLDIIIVGINPGLTAAFVGHHYAGPGNHFWKCLFLSGLIPEQMNAYQDYKLLEHGIGFTNIVERTTRGSADLTRKEIKEGGEILKKKIQKFKPKIAVFNGKGIYEVFCGHKKFSFGKQPDPFPDTDTVIYVMPSSSARCTQLPRAIDKVPFYNALRKLRDHLRGRLTQLDDSEIVFPDVFLKTAVKVKPEVKEEPADMSGAITSEQESQPVKKKRGRKPGSKVKTEATGGDYSENGSCGRHRFTQGHDPSEMFGSLNQGGAWLQPVRDVGDMNPNSAQNVGIPSSQHLELFQPQFDIANYSQGYGGDFTSTHNQQVSSSGSIQNENAQNLHLNYSSASAMTQQYWHDSVQNGFYPQHACGQSQTGQPWQLPLSQSESTSFSQSQMASSSQHATSSEMSQSRQGFAQYLSQFKHESGVGSSQSFDLSQSSSGYQSDIGQNCGGQHNQLT